MRLLLSLLLLAFVLICLGLLAGCMMATSGNQRLVDLALWDSGVLVVNQTGEPLMVSVGSMVAAENLTPGSRVRIEAEAFGNYPTTSSITAMSLVSGRSAKYPLYVSDYSKNFDTWVVGQDDLH